LFDEQQKRRRGWWGSCWVVRRVWRDWCGIYKNLDRLEILGRGRRIKKDAFSGREVWKMFWNISILFEDMY
jgi:hypothetical protein